MRTNRLASKTYLAVSLLVVVGAAIAGVGWWLQNHDSGEFGASPAEGPATMVFSPAGTYASTDADGTGIAVHAFRITPEYIAITYTATGPGQQDTPDTVSLLLVDDRGHVYAQKENVSLGAADGVLGGVLVVEPYVPGGSLLTLEVGEVKTAAGSMRHLGWELPLLRVAQPDEPVSFIERGRLAPEEGVSLGRAHVGVAGPPGSSRTELLVVREGRATSLFGAIEESGDARALSGDEFKQLVGAEGYPKPPSFPWPGISDD